MKHRFIKMTLLSLAMSLSLIGNAQQIFGKWVIPTESYGTRFTNELTFTENGIAIDDKLTPPDYSPVEFSAGGYSPNYDLSFYVLGETFWDGSAPFDWVTTQSPYLQPEFQIINMPGEPNKYYSFFTGDNISDRSTDFHFCYNEIEMVDGTAQLSDKILLRGGLENYISFAITKPDNGEQKLFVCSGRNSNPVYPDYLAGIRMWTITNNSITGGELVISEEDQLLDQWDFDAYNMEYTFYLENNEKKDVMAWIHGIDNPSYQQDVTELIVVNDGIAQKFFLNSGRLAGIEFSTFETGVIYVSSAIGLLKVNFNTGQVVEVLSNNNYQATYLQTAPDGHIYGVSNSGDNLCQINMSTGTFTANYFPFPMNHQVSSQKLLTGTTPYYILPENERVFIPLEETVVVEPESCPDMYDGEVWITVTGGAPFSPPDEPYIISSDPVLSFTWDEDNNWFHAENLTEGTYEYTITDAAGNLIEGEFEKAIELLNQVVLLESSCAEAYEELGDNLMSLRKLSKAERALKQALKANPKSANAHYLLGFLFSLQHKWGKSVEELEAADGIFPNHPEILRCLGWSIYNANRQAQGIAVLERSQSLNPGDQNILCDLGVCHMNSGDEEHAKVCFKQVIQLNPRTDQAAEAQNFLKMIDRQNSSSKEITE